MTFLLLSLSSLLWTFLAMFHDIFISQIVGKFPRNFSGKVPLFSWKFSRKILQEISGIFPTYNTTWQYVPLYPMLRSQSSSLHSRCIFFVELEYLYLRSIVYVYVVFYFSFFGVFW